MRLQELVIQKNQCAPEGIRYYGQLLLKKYRPPKS